MPDVRSPDRPQSTLGDVSNLAGAALGRTRDEAVGIWREARALSQSWQAGGRDSRPPSADRVYFAWYVGLGTMAALRVIEWQLAAIMAAAHTVERYGHRRRVREFVEGLDTGI